MAAPPARLYLGANQFVFTTGALASGLTARPAATLLLSPGGRPFRLRPQRGESIRCTAAFVPPDVARALDANTCGGLVSLNLDPATPAQRCLLHTYGHSGIAPLSTRRLGRFLDPFTGALNGQVTIEDLQPATDRLVRALCDAGTQAPRPPDARVLHAMATLRRGPATDLAALAREVGLSPYRLSHLFRAECGVSMRTYRLWSKLRRGVAAMAGGGNLTQAAAAAGFADLPHMTRTFQAMFGLPPSYIGDRRQVDLQVDGPAAQTWLVDDTACACGNCVQADHRIPA